LKGKVVGLYFSAHWCPPCRAFTPQLASVYNTLQQQGKPFEIVFVSSDKSEQEFKSYLNEMPWKAISFSDGRRQSLGQKYGVQGIPTLVLLDPDGKTLTTDGRSLISSRGAGGFPFGAKIVNEKEIKENKAKEQAAVQAKLDQLESEPAQDTPGVITVQVNCPNGSKHRRRFLPTHTFNHVAQFARACDQSLVHGKFAFKTTMPAKVYANMTQTLGDAAIGPSAALYVQKQ